MNSIEFYGHLTRRFKLLVPGNWVALGLKVVLRVDQSWPFLYLFKERKRTGQKREKEKSIKELKREKEREREKDNE